MRVAGIIAEYNPFHNGHAYLAEKARQSGCTHVVAVMSGNFVQRGEPALMHHSERTRAALNCGIDLVLQLPSVYAVSSAQSFARAGVDILNALGCVDSLVFGSECGDAKSYRTPRSLSAATKSSLTLLQSLKKEFLLRPPERMPSERLTPNVPILSKAPTTSSGLNTLRRLTA